jgi:carbon monoxide dehydrogenase subunit G
MQEMRRDGSERLTAKATVEQLHRAMQDPDNREIRLHFPGSIITTRKGNKSAKFRVEEDGSLTRVHWKTLAPMVEG